MTQSNTSSSRRLEVPFEFQEGLWQLKSPRMKRFLKKGRVEGEKESAIYQRANRGSINIKK